MAATSTTNSLYFFLYKCINSLWNTSSPTIVKTGSRTSTIVTYIFVKYGPGDQRAAAALVYTVNWSCLEDILLLVHAPRFFVRVNMKKQEAWFLQLADRMQWAKHENRHSLNAPRRLNGNLLRMPRLDLRSINLIHYFTCPDCPPVENQEIISPQPP